MGKSRNKVSCYSYRCSITWGCGARKNLNKSNIEVNSQKYIIEPFNDVNNNKKEGW